MAAPRDARVEPQPLPKLVLAAAGLAALDGALALLFLTLWATQPDRLLPAVQSMAGISFLLGIAPIVVGGLLLDRHRKMPVEGIVWARWAVLAGAVLTSVTIIIPVLAAVSMIAAPAGAAGDVRAQ